MMADILHQDYYVYDIYKEYLDKIKHYSLNGTINSLSIRYYKTNIAKSSGVIYELSMLASSQYAAAYDIFDFTPVLEFTPLSYSNDNAEEGQGIIRRTQGTMTILAVTEPLFGDIFNFYQQGSTNEYFDVTDVNFVQSVKDLNIYQISFETSQLYKSSVENLLINRHYYYVKEFTQFYDSVLYNDYSELMANRNNMLDELNTYYDSSLCIYKDDMLSTKIIDKINNVLVYLNSKVKLNVKIIIPYDVLNDNDINQYLLNVADTWYPGPDYIPNDSFAVANTIFNPFEGMIHSSFVELVLKFQELYFKFINYQEPIDVYINTVSDLENVSTGVEIYKNLTTNAIYNN